VKQSDIGAPSWCGNLGSWERKVNSFYSIIGFTNLEFAYFDACYSGRLKISNGRLVEGQPGQTGIAFDGPESDMSWALYMYNPDKSQVYQGWWGPIPIGQPPPAPEDEYQKWTRLEWERLGEEDSLYDALTYVINQQTNFGPQDPVNNYRLKGHGNIWDIFLRNN